PCWRKRAAALGCRFVPDLLGLAPITRTSTPSRNQTRRALASVRLQQPEHLTPLKPQQLRCRLNRQPSLIQIPQQLEPRKLSIAHQPNRHPKHPPENPRAVSSLIGRGVTF